jgi:alkylated DNA repair dioxygenase AlkB
MISDIIHIPQFVDASKADVLFNSILNNTPWQNINYFKRNVSHYDGTLPILNELISTIETTFSRESDGAFMNLYKDGNEYAPYHADKYDRDCCLFSMGTTRILRYKNNDDKNDQTDYELNNGDLLFIPNSVNENYKHSLLKRTKVKEPRISILVFFSST